tara:strand:+ start:412 stop:849 length:438 start_codon:yes stop_codon:yes gene_type:complete
MTKYLAIDPGRSKCGLVFADKELKIISNANLIKSKLLKEYVKKIILKFPETVIIIGNGTSSKEHIHDLNFLGKELIVFEERNTTFRAKERYFELYPIKGIKKFFPKEIFLLNINLDPISALIILEDFCNFKFAFAKDIETKTWQK